MYQGKNAGARTYEKNIMPTKTQITRKQRAVDDLDSHREFRNAGLYEAEQRLLPPPVECARFNFSP